MSCNPGGPELLIGYILKTREIAVDIDSKMYVSRTQMVIKHRSSLSQSCLSLIRSVLLQDDVHICMLCISQGSRQAADVY